jgi:hypothetical protein
MKDYKVIFDNIESTLIRRMFNGRLSSPRINMTAQ